ncbi:MAG: alginate export family protein [Deltaproteobacteria bacterium]|nr:alginate export family protein [Deltaproteobacteria bacterium]
MTTISRPLISAVKINVLGPPGSAGSGNALFRQAGRVLVFTLATALFMVESCPAGSLTFDGEIRERFEILSGMNTKAYGDNSIDYQGVVKGESDDEVLLQRVIAGFTVQQTSHITYRIHAYDSRVWGWSLGQDDFIKNRGTPDEHVMDPDEEHFELLDANLQIGNLFVEGGSAILGRQVIVYGDKRIFGPGSWGNARGWLWDAARLSYRTGGNFVDAWYGQTKTKDPDSFSLTHKHAYQGVGVYGHFETTQNGALEPFFAWKNNLFDETVSEGNLYYYGARLYEKDCHGFHYDLTFAVEDGQIGETPVNAYAYVAKVGFTFKTVYFQPDFVLGRVFASGDSDPSDDTRKTFTRPFGSTTGTHYGRMDIMSWTNMIDDQVSIDVHPCENWDAKIAFHHFSLDQWQDKWGYYKYSNGDGRDDTHIGDEYDFQIRYQYSHHLEYQFIYAYFDAGSFVKNNVEDNDAQRLYIQFTYRFDIGL